MELSQETDSNETGDKTQVRSVTRALEILACFTPDKPIASLSEIARTTASRLIATLEGARFIRRHSDGDYGLGTRLLQFGPHGSVCSSPPWSHHPVQSAS